MPIEEEEEVASHNWQIAVLLGTVSVFYSAIRRTAKSSVDNPLFSNIWSIKGKKNCIVCEAMPHFIFRIKPELFLASYKKVSKTLAKLGVVPQLKV